MNANIEIARRGIMLIVSSPSGAGKTTLTRNLLDKEENVSLSISVTTRARRTSEIDGIHYKFLSRRQFELMRDGGELLEWAEVHGNFYGTPREPVETALAEGRDVLFDIDWQGTQQLYNSMRQDVVSVFVLPPTAEELKLRLERRAEDTQEIIARRLKNAAEEIPHWEEYDYVLVNRDLEKSFIRLRGILTAERLKRVRKEDIQDFVDHLLSDLKTLTP
ncbi:guanylate kinase [Pseudorhodoplanes sinuspersici]|uniref:Guanylate kinase n=1 Tax=Pseudorhodoplanes sinuspersici TaxID=1235591 RepID=A0A1W6ZXY8_9HYPH|nr:guanylate kinase [Pseudorhodoplanes sinuspersici]ARQ02138.1 guanylate kinase [Pseudorhodoplanes sinuspersici]RKE73943.1 guanylate kinase [Pseudorhodoplanes sinuspersici]